VRGLHHPLARVLSAQPRYKLRRVTEQSSSLPDM